MAKIKINKLPAGYSLVDGKIVQQEQPKMKPGGPVKGKFTRDTKRQLKRADAGKKGRYIKEGPLTVEESRLLDDRYPYTSSDMPMMMIPNDFYDADFGYIMGPEIIEGQFNQRARDEERLRRKRNFNTSDGLWYEYYNANGIDPYTDDLNRLKVNNYANGGTTTGDQSNYALTTTPAVVNNEQMSNSTDSDVRYSLSSVPRDKANIEAEGGETVLTDLSQDGNFGLYSIKGPRHSNGGVPMYLPDQSFVFSDTKDMKFNKSEMAEFGIESRKKQTPAKISKKYDLNKYYGAIDDEYADDIQVRSAELMLDKNKKNLSKLAFAQELKKDFEDGVPVSAHPYLVSIGEDPIEFTAKVEEISKQKAMMKALQALPQEEQMKILALQEFLEQAQQQQMQEQQMPQEMPQEMPQDPMMQQMPQMDQGMAMENFMSPDDMELPDVESKLARRGLEMYQKLGEKNDEQSGYYSWGPGNPNRNILGEIFAEARGEEEPLAPYARSATNTNVGTANPSSTSPPNTNQTTTSSQPGTVRGNDGKMYSITDPEIAEQYKPYGINVDQSGIGASKYARIQRKGESGLFGGAKDNLEGFKAWEGIYPGYGALMAEINAGRGNSPEVGRFQAWVNNQYIPQQVQAIAQARRDAGYEFTDDDASTLEGLLIKDYGFSDDVPGRGIDSDFGTVTSSMRPLSFTVPEKKVEQQEEEEVEENKTLDIPDVQSERFQPTPEFWKQDLIRMNAIAQRNRRLGLPWQPTVTPVDIDYTLQDPTRAIAAIAEQKNISDQAMGAFAGPQTSSSKTLGTTGQAMKAVADATYNIHRDNVQTANRADYQQAAMDYKTEALQRAAKVKEYDDTEKALQAYMDEKNFDREQYAQAYMDALTNRANTFNINTTQDYYTIDPSTGGMINQVSSRALDPVKPPADMLDQYISAADRLNKAGITPTGELLTSILAGDASQDPYQTNIQREMSKQNPYLQYGYPTQRKGGEKKLKKYAVPFYIGQVGM